MTSAGILAWGGRLHGCILDERGRPRHFTARNTPTARDAICQNLVRADVNEVIVLAHQDTEPLAQLLVRAGLNAWRAQPRLIDDIVATHPDRRGPRSRAAILARLTRVPAWLAALSLVTLPRPPPEQLTLV